MLAILGLEEEGSMVTSSPSREKYNVLLKREMIDGID